jgi:hypothetical protein
MGADDQGAPPPWGRMTQGQALFAGQAIHKVLAHRPPFAVEPHPNLPVARAHSCLRHLPHPLPECDAGIPMTPIPIRGPRAADGPAHAPFTDVRGGLEIGDHHPPARRP